MRVGDNLEYIPHVPEKLTWAMVREGLNRLYLKGCKAFPDGYFRLYVDQPAMWDLIHDPDFQATQMINSGTLIRDNVLIALFENSFIQDPYIPSFLIVTKSSSAELVGLPTQGIGLVSD